MAADRPRQPLLRPGASRSRRSSWRRRSRDGQRRPAAARRTSTRRSTTSCDGARRDAGHLDPSSPTRCDELMVHVVETGPHYAEETLIPGYVVGGKTGTAQIWDPSAGDWMENTYNHTFVGFVGAEQPEAVILVRIHDTEPTVAARWGKTLEMTSNALFRRVAQSTSSRRSTSSRCRARFRLSPIRASPEPDRPIRRSTSRRRRHPTDATAVRSAMREWPAVADPSLSSVFDAPSLASATGGRIRERGSRSPIRGGAVDSRRVEPGNAFFALPGERTDGHRFVADAVQRGAAAVVVTHLRRRTPTSGDRRTSRSSPSDDALIALQRAAAEWRNRFDPLVVGVTGSLAKTSTKEQIAEVLSERWNVLRNEANENNEIGLPLTLLRMGPEHEVAVLEMGMYTPGDIALLAALARPTHRRRDGRARRASRAGRDSSTTSSAASASWSRHCRPVGPRCSTPTTSESREWPTTCPPASTRLTYGFAANADVRAEHVDVARRATACTSSCARAGGAVDVRDPGTRPAQRPQRARRGRRRRRRRASTSTRSWPVWRGRGARRTAVALDRSGADHGARRQLQRVARLDDRGARPAGRACPAATWPVLGEMLELGDGTSEAEHRAHRRATPRDDGRRRVVEAVHTGPAVDSSAATIVRPRCTDLDRRLRARRRRPDQGLARRGDGRPPARARGQRRST